jgi:hypothetical protein
VFIKEAEATAKREANKKHVAKVHKEAAAAIGEVTPGTAVEIVEAIAAGKIPHVTINY